MIKYKVKATTQFKKDYKLAIKRGLKIDLLEQIVEKLASGVSLPEKNKDHALTGNWRDTANATYFLIGYLFIVLRMTF
ncbi:mRNA interferase YafQ [Paenibacillus turicensis]|uniref:mRNA interferase YafQ n=1 Tax=Paenibacillus turicensis TaxID=160487 RepID=A0ABS4FPF7_9BACL|nr:mRNA interferase YafQ [Paenibacillus turicensis]